MRMSRNIPDATLLTGATRSACPAKGAPAGAPGVGMTGSLAEATGVQARTQDLRPGDFKIARRAERGRRPLIGEIPAFPSTRERRNGGSGAETSRIALDRAFRARRSPIAAVSPPVTAAAPTATNRLRRLIRRKRASPARSSI